MSSLPENVYKRGKSYYYRCRVGAQQWSKPLGHDPTRLKVLARMAGNQATLARAGLRVCEVFPYHGSEIDTL
jgi:hypothetical protein